MKALIMNLGGTSTKVAIYDKNQMILKESIRHPYEEIKGFKKSGGNMIIEKNAFLVF